MSDLEEVNMSDHDNEQDNDSDTPDLQSFLNNEYLQSDVESDNSVDAYSETGSVNKTVKHIKFSQHY